MPKYWQRDESILLNPRIPEPLHGLVPRKLLGSTWWNNTRKSAYASTNFHCKACGVHKSQAKGPKHLEGHELYHIDFYEGRSTYLQTVPLCHYCHNFIHSGRLFMLHESGRMPRQKYLAILRHGDQVLANAGLRKQNIQQQNEHYLQLQMSGTSPPWNDWRLVLLGVEHRPLFSSVEEYRQHWSEKERIAASSE